MKPCKRSRLAMSSAVVQSVYYICTFTILYIYTYSEQYVSASIVHEYIVVHLFERYMTFGTTPGDGVVASTIVAATPGDGVVASTTVAATPGDGVVASTTVAATPGDGVVASTTVAATPGDGVVASTTVAATPGVSICPSIIEAYHDK